MKIDIDLSKLSYFQLLELKKEVEEAILDYDTGSDLKK